MTQFRDLFGHQASDYARFRPRYPGELFEYLASLAQCHDLAWDAGTGNGQAAVCLAEYFDHVIATDPSEKQLASAELHPKVKYAVGVVPSPQLERQSVDLITVAQAFHWFNQDAFFAEARRVLKPGGVLAFWCYELCEITPEIDAVVLHLYRDILGGYWEPERKLVEEGYRNIKMPFSEIQSPIFTMTSEWTMDHLVGYLRTWSALQAFVKKNKSNPLELIYPKLAAVWGDVSLRSVRWDLATRVGRN